MFTEPLMLLHNMFNVNMCMQYVYKRSLLLLGFHGRLLTPVYIYVLTNSRNTCFIVGIRTRKNILDLLNVQTKDYASRIVRLREDTEQYYVQSVCGNHHYPLLK